MSLLAELELFHSRPIAPTRRLVVGRFDLPTDPPPGPGGTLLGAVAARYGTDLDEDDRLEVERLMADIEAGRRVVQPRLRHRLQRDRVGLLRSHLRLAATNGARTFELGSQGAPLVYLLAAIYAGGGLAPSGRTAAFSAIRRGLRWHGALDETFVAHLGGRSDSTGWQGSGLDPLEWALATLGFDPIAETPPDDDIRRRFREQLRAAHPDHGGEEDDAADRIAELSEARRLLLG